MDVAFLLLLNQMASHFITVSKTSVGRVAAGVHSLALPVLQSNPTKCVPFKFIGLFFGFKHHDFLLSFFLKVKVAKNWAEGLDSSVAGEHETLEDGLFSRTSTGRAW